MIPTNTNLTTNQRMGKGMIATNTNLTTNQRIMGRGIIATNTNFYNESTNNNEMESKIIYKDLSYKIVGILFEVYNELGYGFQEKYYQRAIAKMLQAQGIPFQEQVPYKIAIKNIEIGRYYLDFLVEDKIVLEIKKGRHYPKKNIEQVKGYLHVTGKKLAILANFTPDGVRTLRIPNI